jgi:hypothetical protein
METYNYDFFLFCELARYDNKELTQEPYDVQFPIFVELFNEYEKSYYGGQDKSGYDCIIDFLKSKENQKLKLVEKIQSIIKEDLNKIDYSTEMIDNINRVLKQYKNQ